MNVSITSRSASRIASGETGVDSFDMAELRTGALGAIEEGLVGRGEGDDGGGVGAEETVSVALSSWDVWPGSAGCELANPILARTVSV
jgi:hypothetical protein